MSRCSGAISGCDVADPIDPFLEAEYNVRAAIPEHPRIFADWAERSRAARVRQNAVLDRPYGGTAGETLDLFLAPNRHAPINAFIHGGYWQSRDKSEFSFLADGLVPSGVNVAVLNYGLCPSVSLSTIVAQIRGAFLWLWRNARAYGADPDQLHVSGHSAGGHLAAMLLATDWRSLDETAPADLVRSGLSISGLFDLDPLRGTSLNRALALDAATARSLSPIFMDPNGCHPLVLAVGEAESGSFHDQSARMAAAWGRFGVPIERLNLSGCHHLTAVDELARAGSPLHAAALRVMRGA